MPPPIPPPHTHARARARTPPGRSRPAAAGPRAQRGGGAGPAHGRGKKTKNIPRPRARPRAASDGGPRGPRQTPHCASGSEGGGPLSLFCVTLLSEEEEGESSRPGPPDQDPLINTPSTISEYPIQTRIWSGRGGEALGRLKNVCTVNVFQAGIYQGSDREAGMQGKPLTPREPSRRTPGGPRAPREPSARAKPLTPRPGVRQPGQLGPSRFCEALLCVTQKPHKLCGFVLRFCEPESWSGILVLL